MRDSAKKGSLDKTLSELQTQATSESGGPKLEESAQDGDFESAFDSLVASDDAADSPDTTKPRVSQADLIVRMIEQMGVELMHDSAHVPYARIRTGDVRATYTVHESSFRAMLAAEFYKRHRKAPPAASLADARRVIEGKALHEGRLAEVALRVAGDDDAIDVDLCDEAWRMVHIDANGWDVRPHGDQLFRRAPGMLRLPLPVRGGTLDQLRDFVRTGEDGWALLVAWLVCAVRPRGPYPILVLAAEQGAGKSMIARILRRLLDPNKADLRCEPRDPRDLAIAATNAYVIALDNVSRISGALSDALCRTSTGGGYSTRMLYTDGDEKIFEAQRPIITASITDVVSKPDLLDRCLSVPLQPIPESERRTESELWAAFDVAHPRLFGALLDAVVTALRTLPDVRRTLKGRPRMADAYEWAIAASPAFGVGGAELREAWNRTREDAYAQTRESSVIASPLTCLVGDEWSGTASNLLGELATLVPEAETRRREWPKTPKALGNMVRTLAPALRAIGIDHAEAKGPGRKRDRLHVFTRIEAENTGDFASAPSASSANQRNHGNWADRAADVGESLRPLKPASVRENRLIHEGADAADNADGKIRLHSADDDFVPLTEEEGCPW